MTNPEINKSRTSINMPLSELVVPKRPRSEHWLQKIAARMGVVYRDCIEKFVEDLRVRNLSPTTIEDYTYQIGKFYEYLVERGLKLDEVNRDVIRQWILHEKGRTGLRTGKPISDYSINDNLRVLKVWFKFMIDEGIWLGENPMEKVKLLRTEKRLKPILSTDEMKKLLAVPDRSTFTGLRNYCLLLVMYEAMLRQAEVLTLKSSDIDWQTGTVKVFGKGRRERKVDCLGDKAMSALAEYWTQRRNRPGSTFFAQENGKPLKPRYTAAIVEKFGLKSGLRVYCHLLRHTGATHRAQAGENIIRLQKLLGHSSVVITEHYVNWTGELLDGQKRLSLVDQF